MIEKIEYRRITISRVQSNYNENEHLDNEDEVKYGDIERYEILKTIGSGKYSTVFLGAIDDGTFCAIKILKNYPQEKIFREIQVLSHLSSVPNVIKLYDVLFDEISHTISIVTEYLESIPIRTLVPTLTLEDIRFLMHSLLVSLDSCHKHGVMHRDIKPGNVLISPSKKQLRIIDWGLADYYFPERMYSVRVSTLRYKAPELLLNYQYYDYGVDIWSAGCVFAELLIKYPFFEGCAVDEMICSVAALCGTDSIYTYMEKYGLNLSHSALANFPSNPNPTWNKSFNLVRSSKKDELAFDLLKKMLTIDHENRITAHEAISHHFFDTLKPPN